MLPIYQDSFNTLSFRKKDFIHGQVQLQNNDIIFFLEFEKSKFNTSWTFEYFLETIAECTSEQSYTHHKIDFKTDYPFCLKLSEIKCAPQQILTYRIERSDKNSGETIVIPFRY